MREMGRKKKADSFRTIFTVQVKEFSHMYGNIEKTIEVLKAMKGIGGVYFDNEQLNSDTFKITSRGNRSKYAIMDYNYLSNHLNKYCGELIKIEMQGRTYNRRKVIWDNEWEEANALRRNNN